jgi:ParB/RepB/Spo0J family partition protein
MTTPESKVKMVPFNEIGVSDINARKHLKDVAGLAASIKENGLLEPLVVTNGGAGKYPYTLSAGNRRHAALSFLKWGTKEVPVVISTQDNAIINLVENIQRDDLPAFDLARQLAAMRDGTYRVPEGQEARKWDKAELATKIGKSAAHVRNLLRVDENIVKEVKKKIGSKDPPARFLFALAGMTPEAQVEAADAWVAEQEATEKLGAKKRPRKKTGDKDEGGGGGKDGFVSAKKVVSIIKGTKYTLPDYVAVLEAKSEQVKSKEEALLLQGRAEALKFILGMKGFKKFPGIVADDFDLIAEEDEEEEAVEEEEVAEE